MTSSDVVAGTTGCLARYAAAVDARDADAIAALLVEDVLLTRGSSTLETFEGRTAFLEAYRPFLEGPTLASRHAISNPVVEETGDGAVTVRSCFEATMFLPESTRRVYGRYEDDLVLVDGDWRIAHKRNYLEWAVDGPAATRL